MVENEANAGGGRRDILGLTLFVASSFLFVLVLMHFLSDSTENATGTAALAGSVVGALGHGAPVLMAAGLAWLAALVFLGREDLPLGRHAAGVVGISLGLAVLLGALADQGGALGAALGGTFVEMGARWLGVLVGLAAVSVPAWLAWFRDGSGILEKPGKKHAASAVLTEEGTEGVSTAEAALLVPDESTLAYVEKSWRESKDKVEAAATPAPPSPYPEDPRLKGQIPPGARPLGSDAPVTIPQGPIPAAAPSGATRWTPTEGVVSPDVAPGADLATADPVDAAEASREGQVGAAAGVTADDGDRPPVPAWEQEDLFLADLADQDAQALAVDAGDEAALGVAEEKAPAPARRIPRLEGEIDVEAILAEAEARAARAAQKLEQAEIQREPGDELDPSSEAADSAPAPEAIDEPKAAEPGGSLDDGEPASEEGLPAQQDEPEAKAQGTEGDLAQVEASEPEAAADEEAPEASVDEQQAEELEAAAGEEAETEEPEATVDQQAEKLEEGADEEQAEIEERLPAVDGEESEAELQEAEGVLDEDEDEEAEYEEYEEDEDEDEDDEAAAEYEDEEYDEEDEDEDEDAEAAEYEEYEDEEDEDEYEEDEDAAAEYDEEEYDEEEEDDEEEDDEAAEYEEYDEEDEEGEDEEDEEAAAELEEEDEPVAEDSEPEVVLEPRPASGKAPKQPSSTTPDSPASHEELVHECGLLFLREGRVAVSMLQKGFALDFAEACAILDELQEAGLLGPYLGGKQRDILLSLEEWTARVPAS